MRPSFFHHLHPPTIPAAQSRLRYTLGAGGLAVFFAIATGISGALVMFYYAPTPDQAALSIQTLTYHVPFGWLARNLHYWSAQLLVLFSALHLLRVVFTGAYAPPRRLNFLLGVALLALCIFFDFTGYALRWDSGVQWAIVAGTNLVRSIPLVGSGLYTFIVGAEFASAPTLLRFYTWHIFGLTLIFMFIGVWHLFKVRRDGGIAVPPPEMRSDTRRITRFELARREALAALLATTGLVVLALLFPAPIGSPISDTTAPSADGRAPWFFLWVQRLLRLGDPFFWGVLVPTGVLLLIAAIPYAFSPPQPAELGRWFARSGRAAQLLAASLAVLLIVLTILQSIPPG